VDIDKGEEVDMEEEAEGYCDLEGDDDFAGRGEEGVVREEDVSDDDATGATAEL
jgi:hypothetical protein